jgi:membrane-bound inhibitor of C-type lysozyme
MLLPIDFDSVKGVRIAKSCAAAYLVLVAIDAACADDEVQVEAIRGTALSTAAALPRSKTLAFTCGDVEFLVRIGSSQVELVLADRTLVLPQVAAASGARYQEGRAAFWSKGNEARIEVEGKVYPGCIRRPDCEP